MLELTNKNNESVGQLFVFVEQFNSFYHWRHGRVVVAYQSLLAQAWQQKPYCSTAKLNKHCLSVHVTAYR